MLKIADKKLAKLGFKKVDDGLHVEYQRYNKKYNFTQVLFLCHKQNGYHIVQSYDKDLMDEEKIGNICVGLTAYEMKLCLRKMKEKRWKIKK